MPYEIWMICDKCNDRIPVNVESLADLSTFALEIALRTRGYLEAGGAPDARLKINCPPCGEGVPGIAGDGTTINRPKPGSS